MNDYDNKTTPSNIEKKGSDIKMIFPVIKNTGVN